MVLQSASHHLIKRNTVRTGNKVVSYNPLWGHMVWSSLWIHLQRNTCRSLCRSFDLFWNVPIFSSFRNGIVPPKLPSCEWEPHRVQLFLPSSCLNEDEEGRELLSWIAVVPMMALGFMTQMFISIWRKELLFFFKFNEEIGTEGA